MTSSSEAGRPANLTSPVPDVFYSSDPLVVVGPHVLTFLKAQAALSPRGRSRLCTHADPTARVHEMFIVHRRDVYVRPHRHHGRAESAHCVEGAARIVLYAADGRITNVFDWSDGPGAIRYVRIGPGVYHGLLVRSAWLVFAETTEGPFERANIEYAPWSLPDDGSAETVAYAARLEREAALFWHEQASSTRA